MPAPTAAPADARNAGAVASILLVDDDDGIRTLVADFLRRHGYGVEVAADGAAMDRALARSGAHFDLIVLDLMLPGEHGLSIARRLSGADAPAIIILSAAGDANDRIIGLEVGADDYLAKPCNPRELLARIRAVLRRKAAPMLSPARAAAFAGWSFDLVQRQLRTPEGVLISLADSEFLLLKALVEAPMTVLTREQLLQRTHSGAELPERAIDVQVSRLRHKLDAGGGQQLVRTIRNGGYLFAADVAWS